MRLYLVQHGQALPKEANPERPLSEPGQTDINRLARFLQKADIQVSQVIHSGKKRAQQTADLLVSSICPGETTQEGTGLNPNDPVEEFALKVSQWQEDILVVSHLPFVAKLLDHLVAKNLEEVVSFRPGTIVCLERIDSQGWKIAWMIRPELLT
jgi:phosphohistidine phosphatase